jgi:hypothetical protein
MLKFELTIEEANVILASLGRQPYETVAAIISKIQQQAQPQLAAMQTEEKATEAAAE